MNRPASASPVLAAYMTRHGIKREALRNDGRLTLNIDGRYRLHVHPVVGNRLVFEARIVVLPTDRVERERLVDLALRVSCARMQASAAACVMDRFDEALWLQEVITADLNPREFEFALGGFVNALVNWSAAVGVR